MVRHKVIYPKGGSLRHNHIVDRVKDEFRTKGYDVYDGFAVMKYLPKLEKYWVRTR